MTPFMVEKLSKCLENRSRLISLRGRMINSAPDEIHLEAQQIGGFYASKKSLVKLMDECIDEAEKFLSGAGVEL